MSRGRDNSDAIEELQWVESLDRMLEESGLTWDEYLEQQTEDECKGCPFLDADGDEAFEACAGCATSWSSDKPKVGAVN